MARARRAEVPARRADDPGRLTLPCPTPWEAFTRSRGLCVAEVRNSIGFHYVISLHYVFIILIDVDEMV